MTHASPLVIDSVTVPSGVYGNDAVDYLESLRLDPESFDYRLWTDGSGHQDGYGASAAVWASKSGDADVVMSANYGQTVARNEFGAMLDGLHAIITHALIERARIEDLPKKAVSVLRDADRVTVAWYTDRQNLALSTVYSELDGPVYSRSTDQDLWARYAWLTRHMCVFPFYRPRNTEPNQGTCDSLCTLLRDAAKGSDALLRIATIDTNTKWLPRSQRAMV